MLIRSWNLVRHGDHSNRLSRTSSQEFAAQIAARELKNAVLEKGLACLKGAHESLLWASHDCDSSSAHEGIAENAAKVSTQRIRRLFISYK